MVKVRKSLIGLRFGKLLVTEQVEDYISSKGIHYAQYKCLCDCGNITVVNSNSLKMGLTKSCGCSQSGAKDLTSMKFGKWSVLYRVPTYIQPNGNHIAKWHCKCECGYEQNISAGDLLRGICTQHQNTMNKKNDNEYTGIRWHHNRYEVCIGQKYLKSFSNKEEALNARLEAEEKYYGEYSYKESKKIGEKNNEDNQK